jgi:hypothetical protein
VSRASVLIFAGSLMVLLCAWIAAMKYGLLAALLVLSTWAGCGLLAYGSELSEREDNIAFLKNMNAAVMTPERLKYLQSAAEASKNAELHAEKGKVGR